MRSGMRVAAVLAAVLGLFGCVGNRPVVTNPEQYRTAIVVAALPETLVNSYIGVTVFQNEREIVPVEWGLSDKALGHLATAAGRRYQVTPVAVDPVAFEGLALNDEAKVPEALKRAVGARSADLVIFMDAVTSVKPGDTNPNSPRMGAILGERAFGKDAGTSIMVMANFRVYDGRSFSQIASTGVGARQPFQHRTRGEPHSSFTPQVKEDVRAAVLARLPEAVELGLRQLGLN